MFSVPLNVAAGRNNTGPPLHMQSPAALVDAVGATHFDKSKRPNFYTDAVDLESELASARRFALSDAELLATLDDLTPYRDQWGIAAVAFDRHVSRETPGLYVPDAAGEPSFVIAAEEAGEVVDLVAYRPRDGATASRMGIASVLGRFWIDFARWHRCRLPVFETPLAWLKTGSRGVVIVDWSRIRFDFADVGEVVCGTPALKARIDRALAATPACLPRVTLMEPRHG